jgi:hypothetical protein
MGVLTIHTAVERKAPQLCFYVSRKETFNGASRDHTVPIAHKGVLNGPPCNPRFGVFPCMERVERRN